MSSRGQFRRVREFQEGINSSFLRYDVLTMAVIIRTTIVVVIVRGEIAFVYYATRNVIYAQYACIYYTRALNV